jgi:hypothetical protein
MLYLDQSGQEIGQTRECPDCKKSTMALEAVNPAVFLWRHLCPIPVSVVSKGNRVRFSSVDELVLLTCKAGIRVARTFGHDCVHKLPVPREIVSRVQSAGLLIGQASRRRHEIAHQCCWRANSEIDGHSNYWEISVVRD